MPGNVPTTIRLYRIVHFQNVEYILKNGMYTRQSPHFDPNYVNIGDNTLISERHDYPVRIQDYGSLGDYVPFYFAGRSPMLLNIKTGFRGIAQRPQHEIIYFVCKLDDVLDNCKKWFFTDGHAKNSISDFFIDLEDLIKIDWDVVKLRIWKQTEEDHDRMRRKQAEFLIKDHVPVVCIEKILVMDDTKKQLIEDILEKLNISITVTIDNQNKVYYP